jgi:lysophospholipase L1-like esterase
MSRPVLGTGLLFVSALVIGACTGPGRPATPAVAPGDQGPPVTYVAVGASESVGVGTDDPLREAWPQLLYRDALPRRTVFVNLGIPGATVERALDDEVAQAVGLSPTIATVWLNVNDIAALVPPSVYEQRLDTLVSRLRRGGATRVLVANTPPLDKLPAVDRLGLPAAAVNLAVDQYNAAVARVVAKEGAVLVDLHKAGLDARAAGREAELVSADGFHPSAAGHRAVADAFAAALQASGPVR